MANQEQYSILAMSMQRMRLAHHKFDMLNKPLELDHLGNKDLYVIITDSEENMIPLPTETRAFKRLIDIELEIEELKAKLKPLVIEKKQIVDFLK